MYIRIDVGYTIKDGTEILFRSPVDCSAITGLIVYYPDMDGNETAKEFAFADAHGNNVGDIDHLFAENVVVKVILDVTAGMAFVQNADTNAYLEGRFNELDNVFIGKRGAANILKFAEAKNAGKMCFLEDNDGTLYAMASADSTAANFYAYVNGTLNRITLYPRGGFTKENVRLVKSINGIVPKDDGSITLDVGSGGGTGGSGADGFSPIANVTQTSDGAVISITDKAGTTTATITNGKDGSPGADGKTPIKGTDYFTEADKQELAEAAAGLVEVPEATMKPLTFTGAVNATYDGSEAVSVEIPTGGGGSGGGRGEWKLVLDIVTDYNQEYQPLTLDFETGVMTFEGGAPTNSPRGLIPNLQPGDDVTEAWKYVPNEFITPAGDVYDRVNNDGTYGTVTSISTGVVNSNVDVNKFHFENMDGTARTWNGLNCKKLKFEFLAPGFANFPYNRGSDFNLLLSDGTTVNIFNTFDDKKSPKCLQSAVVECHIIDNKLWVKDTTRKRLIGVRTDAKVKFTETLATNGFGLGKQLNNGVNIVGIEKPVTHNQQCGLFNGTVIRIWEG